ncbi:unnamed protein product [Symbiodinium sp. KB8]|nr:unnamed protein product [Symbiodinium sp. KB8]|mmetsp:Transcript_3593/g.8681  ORF Transcript_3593/g.8681 Transcript_3593/m.8681 type:complete len:251 (-) Transcript_3593:77-829(-)|eukprot:CAMPEP_0181403308 /NCGR_PEP_ID=MMETSP1110-20121109/3639_1 /TAXON_ID=174948 /ORGANISM="Symbiodinium sp., Strain CCMP421" /LENGTH=250 /DNA_ID=CAMNT_0023525585 /DNA_START=52 /DNA_END=804 /DNA_ORIENTATION=+
MPADIPDDVKKQLMNDPKVQKALQEQAAKTGKDAMAALQDPEVQKMIMDTCKEKFPEYASQAQAKIREFCNDPEVQAAAKKYASMAGAYVMQAGGALVAQIEQGPAGVRFLCFLASCFSLANGILKLISISRITSEPVKYVLSMYQVLFSVTTMLFEAPPEYIAKVSGLSGYQDLLMEKCKFLSETIGRGGFYIFQGTLWLCFASLTDILDLAAGFAMVCCGILNLLIHFGGFATFAQKVKAGYSAVGGQ